MKSRSVPAGIAEAILPIVILSAAAWAMTIWSVSHMDQPIVRLMMPMTSVWSLREAGAVWAMWSVMMAAMMLPSTIIMVTTHRRLAQSKQQRNTTTFFVAGYLIVWSIFSLAASLLQWWLQELHVMSHMLVLKDGWVPGTVLILAGAVQWTPMKDVCLSMCRTPIGFFAAHWRSGRGGALRMGVRHGTFCVGCCWALMALLFVAGVMNLVAIFLLSGLVAAEKLLPFGDRIARYGGLILVAWGVSVFVGSLGPQFGTS